MWDSWLDESWEERRRNDADLMRFERESRMDDDPSLTFDWGGTGEIRDAQGVVIVAG